MENEQQYQDSKQISYPTCNLNGFHNGEIMNTICLEEDCRTKSLLCSVCVHEQHKNHKLQSLKLFIHENYKKYEQLSQGSTSGLDQTTKESLLQYLNALKQDVLSDFKQQVSKIVQLGYKIEQDYIQYFDVLKEQIEKQYSFSSEMSKVFDNIYDDNIGLQELQNNVKRLLDYQDILLNQDEEETDNSNVKNQNQNHQETQINKTQEQLKGYTDEMKTQIVDYTDKISQTIKDIDIMITNQIEYTKENWYTKSQVFKFLESHHPQIKIKDSVTVVSNSISGYKVAVLEPMILNSKQCEFAFNIKHIGASNWIGVGICHKQKVVSNSFGFSSSILPHGIYMISSNAGSWSSTQKQFNSCIKSFTFVAGDTIICTYNPIQKTLLFKKLSNTKQTYQLSLEQETDFQFNPAVIVYSQDDEVIFQNKIPAKK